MCNNNGAIENAQQSIIPSMNAQWSMAPLTKGNHQNICDDTADDCAIHNGTIDEVAIDYFAIDYGAAAPNLGHQLWGLL